MQNNYNVTVFDSERSDIESGKFVKGDILNLESVKKAVNNSDVVIHLVGLADAGIAQKEPMKSFGLNVVSLQNVLEACRSSGKKKIVFPSSAAVYGITQDLPIKESFPLNPTNIYSWHKVICERMIQAYQKNYGIEYVILRLFNVYGHENKGVINAFINKAKKAQVIESFGPYQYRDFIYAGDIAEAIYKAVVYEKAYNRSINIGSGKGIQIREILEIICDIFPRAKWKEIKSNFIMYDSIAEITLAKILLDFEPNSSKDFLKKIIKEEML
jgi:UDP-glucose 4-epimerase